MKYLCVFYQIAVKVQIVFLFLLYLWLLLYYYKDDGRPSPRVLHLTNLEPE